jgi:AP-1 complex subunit beta-1
LDNNNNFEGEFADMATITPVKQKEMQDLQECLNSRNLEDKRIGLKRVIAQMTLGRDVSALFQSVLKCLEHSDLDIKKLVYGTVIQVYLYTINYSRVSPDDAIMSINLFRKDAANKGNAIIRALAVRTMSSLRVPKLNEYLVEPLKTAMKDDDPYVRKTAVLSVPKMFEIAPDDP